MGKRELLLIVAFVAVGAVVYQLTAPPPGPGERGFSLGRLLDNIRREVQGRRANAEIVDTRTHPIEASTAEVRVGGSFIELHIEGEDREDIETTLRVSSTGTDDAEANHLAQETIGYFKTDRAAGVIGLRLDRYPDPGTQRSYLTIKVPARLRLRVEVSTPRSSVANVAGVEFNGARGEANIRNVGGRVVVSHRAGKIVIDRVGTLKFTGRSSDAIVSTVRGEASFVLEAGGELHATDLAGPLEAEGRSAELTFDKLENTRGPIRVNVVGGSVVLRGVAAESRVDGRNSEIELTMAAPAPISVFSEGEDGISLLPPPGGYQLDALATHGRISLPDEIKQVVTIEGKSEGEEARAAGLVKGGGPMLTLRSTRGDITILTPETKKAER
jgi:hypothetical protein